jgi:hypothetical protein
MPVYFAGWVRGTDVNPSVKFGSGFTISRVAATGSYRITVSHSLTSKWLATTVTPVTPNCFARISTTALDPLTATTRIEIETRDGGGNAVNCEFTFIAVERS